MRHIGWGFLFFVVGCSGAAAPGVAPGQDAGHEEHDAGNAIDAAPQEADAGGAHDSASPVDAQLADAGHGDPNFGRACPSNQFDDCNQLSDGTCELGYTASLGIEEHGTCTILCGASYSLTCEEAGAPPGSTCEGPDSKGRSVCIPPH